MKIYTHKLVVLCVFHPDVWGATSFFARAPPALMPKGRAWKSKEVLPPAFSYLGSLGSPPPDSSNSTAKTEYTSTFNKPNIDTPDQSGPVWGNLPTTPEQAPPMSMFPSEQAPPMPAYMFPSEQAPPMTFPPKPVPSDVVPMQSIKNVWDTLKPIKVQGGSLRTWSFTTSAIQRVQVMLKTDGRPLRANIELWQGPDNTPQRMDVYNEDGDIRPFNCVIETPRGQNAVAIRNTGQMEFPLYACLAADVDTGYGITSMGLGELTQQLDDMGKPRIIQGGALSTFPFDSSVSSVQILLKTDGRPLDAKVELLQGPNNIKQIIELYCEDGYERPFFIVIETPGSGNVVRIINTATMEFPLTARVEPYIIERYSDSEDGNDGLFVLDGQW